MYIINCQKDGDDRYHIHTKSCTHGPASNFKSCSGTISDAASKINVAENKISKCSFCMK